MEKQESKKKVTKAEMDQALLDNFIGLQKVLTNLTLKFDGLSTNIEKLLQLFEISAKSFAENSSNINSANQKELDKDFLNKLDSLLDQNKTISKGILMMEEKVRNRATIMPPESRFKAPYNSKPLVR
jgi:hypothetical protein